ncbi:MAG: hypothetical protein FJ271_22440 [Planctomycetes bacterium]|nr:hypothetical protein [Planctomycetota bacterium]
MERIRDPQFPEEVRNLARASLGRLQAVQYFLIAALPLAIIGGMLAMERRGLWAALLLLLAAAGPVGLATGYAMAIGDIPVAPGATSPVVMLYTLTGIPGALLVIAALFACFCKPVPASMAPVPRESRRHDAD